MDVVSGRVVTHDAQTPSGQRRWYAQPELWLLVLVALGTHFVRLPDLTIRGEESRRARVAYEMMESGDWVVPRQQGLPYYSRPPLGSWLIALSAMVWGDFDAWSVRFPSAIATLLTSLLIYGYARNFLTPLGAMASGVAYLTMLQVMELGRMAESEAVLTVMLTASLLLWHWGYVKNWASGLTWAAGYGFAALAGLTKGPQGPIYFVAVSVVFLFLRRDWRFLFSAGHAIGLLVFATVIGLWQVPFYLATNWEAVPLIWGKNAAIRYGNSGFLALVLHLLSFPFEVWAAMLPWSVLPVVFFHRGFRQSIDNALPYVAFLVVALLVTFPSCWIAIEARTRYFMPLFPCVAILCGLAIDRSVMAVTREPSWTHHWYRFVGLFGLGAAVGASVICVASVFGLGGSTALTQPSGFAFGYMIVGCLMAFSLLWLRREHQYWRHAASLIVVACFLAVTFDGVRINELVRKSVPSDAQVQEVVKALPEDAQLVSLGKVHHLFAYYYEQTIPAVPWSPAKRRVNEPGFEYFCVNKWSDNFVKLPFDWEEIATVNCDRRLTENPGMQVVVGRRLRNTEVIGQREETDVRQ